MHLALTENTYNSAIVDQSPFESSEVTPTRIAASNFIDVEFCSLLASPVLRSLSLLTMDGSRSPLRTDAPWNLATRLTSFSITLAYKLSTAIENGFKFESPSVLHSLNIGRCSFTKCLVFFEPCGLALPYGRLRDARTLVNNENTLQNKSGSTTGSTMAVIYPLMWWRPSYRPQ